MTIYSIIFGNKFINSQITLVLQTHACGQIMKPINKFFFRGCVAQWHITIVEPWMNFCEINFLQWRPESQQYGKNVDIHKI